MHGVNKPRSDPKLPIGVLKHLRGLPTKVYSCRQGWPVESRLRHFLAVQSVKMQANIVGIIKEAEGCSIMRVGSFS